MPLPRRRSAGACAIQRHPQQSTLGPLGIRPVPASRGGRIMLYPSEQLHKLLGYPPRQGLSSTDRVTTRWDGRPQLAQPQRPVACASLTSCARPPCSFSARRVLLGGSAASLGTGVRSRFPHRGSRNQGCWDADSAVAKRAISRPKSQMSPTGLIQERQGMRDRSRWPEPQGHPLRAVAETFANW